MGTAKAAELRRGEFLWAEETRKGSMEEVGLRMDRMWMWQEDREH